MTEKMMLFWWTIIISMNYYQEPLLLNTLCDAAVANDTESSWSWRSPWWRWIRIFWLMCHRSWGKSPILVLFFFLSVFDFWRNRVAYCTRYDRYALSIPESPAPLIIFASTMTKWCKFGAHSSHLKQWLHWFFFTDSYRTCIY